MTSQIIDASDDAERQRISDVTGKHPENVHILPPTLFLKSQMTILRDCKTVKSAEFRRAADHITRLLIEEAVDLGWIRCQEEVPVTTPTEETVDGVRLPEDGLVAVSIVRAGESMEGPVQEIFPEARIGKILIQRDEETATPHLYYIKLPSCKSSPHVLLLDPMLATGGSCMMAIESLLDSTDCDIKEEDIIFLNLISCPKGIENLTAAYPKVRIVSGCLDRCLNERSYILPGLGDFGDRYFGTQ
ncbi:hypothetical protein FOZ63_027532 [Perkinsus olseni]|uniref:uracil phosphoribosyltransferase n=1 Tax=Perkinsus olseni TaxID=32597 RepID=A0A7J6SXD7_PEROL|nr:hypothetical protein FOZ63_027532 [Perkinsus olseni]KAF4737407.1 hypothetical protein FOZ62_027113 [Perkinsus olseni]